MQFLRLFRINPGQNILISINGKFPGMQRFHLRAPCILYISPNILFHFSTLSATLVGEYDNVFSLPETDADPNPISRRKGFVT